MRRALAVALGLALALAPRLSAEESHLLVVVGLGGEPAYTEAFHELAVSMVSAAEKTLAVPPPNIAYLGEKATSDAPAYKGRSTRENVQKALADLARRAQPDDMVLVLLIGHGSFQAGESRFNLPGPDMTAADFAPLLDRLPSRRVAFVNTASASGEFVKVLAGRGRTIVTATKSGMEGNETVFARYFVAAFTEGSADADKDGRVSVQEAFAYARREVQRFYDKEHRLLTEHAVLSDEGQTVATAGAGPSPAEGGLARTLFLGPSTPSAAPTSAAGDPARARLRDQARDLERRIAALKSRKAQMAAAPYEDELESLLLELAKSEEALRGHEAPR